jgi:hypothetical protein
MRTCSDAQLEVLALQGAKQDLELGQAILIDKLQQCKSENQQMVQQMAKLKARITNSTQDYVSADSMGDEKQWLCCMAASKTCKQQQAADHQHQEVLSIINKCRALNKCRADSFVQVDILQHRGEQIKAADARASSLQQQLERLQQDLAQAAKDVAILKVPAVLGRFLCTRPAAADTA